MAGHVELEQMERGAERGEGVAELVRQHREELVLAPIGIRELRGTLLQLVGQALALGHVRADADHPRHAAGGVAHDAALGGHPADAPVGPDGAELDVVARTLLRGAGDGAVHEVAVVRMDERAKGRVRASEAAGRQAVDGFQVLGPPDLSGEKVPVPRTHAAAFERQAEPSFAQLQPGVVRGTATLGTVALGDGRAEQQGADGHHRIEELQRDEVLMWGSHREGPPALHRAQDGQARGDERHRHRAALAEPEGSPDDEGEDLVRQRVPHEPRTGRLDEDQHADGEEPAEERQAFDDPARSPARPRRARPYEEDGSHDEVAHRIADPPDPPDRREGVPGLNAPDAEAHDADRRADDRAPEGREDHEGKDVLQAFESAVEPDAAQQPGADDSLERVADGDAARGADRLVVRGVGQECPQRDPRPGAAAEHQQRGEGDARRRPYERHLLRDEGEAKPEVCGHEVGDRGTRDERGRDQELLPRRGFAPPWLGLCPALRQHDPECASRSSIGRQPRSGYHRDCRGSNPASIVRPRGARLARCSSPGWQRCFC